MNRKFFEKIRSALKKSFKKGLKMQFCQQKNIVPIIYGHKDAKLTIKTMEIHISLFWPKNRNSTPETTLWTLGP